MFSEQQVSGKIGSSVELIKERLKELQQKGYVEYIDGALSSIKFLKPRDERLNRSVYWKLFEHIQKNKIQKWEEMKFYIEDDKYCKMKSILLFWKKMLKTAGNVLYVNEINSRFSGKIFHSRSSIC
jgi:ATP-dependent DNA helicase RecQ